MRAPAAGGCVMARMTSCKACGAMISAEASLCPRCGVRLDPDVAHDCGEPELDTRWAKLGDLL